MGDKEPKEKIKLMKVNAVYLKCLVQEVQLLRRDISKHSKKQEAGLKKWQEADTKHHLSDNGTLAETVKLMCETVKAMTVSNAKMNRFFDLWFEDEKPVPTVQKNDCKDTAPRREPPNRR